MTTKQPQLEQRILRICSSHECKNTRQTYVLLGFDNTIWHKLIIYECLKCGNTYKFRFKPRGR